MNTFFECVKNNPDTVILIQDLENHIFGAYCDTEWLHPREKRLKGDSKLFFGNGQNFIFKFKTTNLGENTDKFKTDKDISICDSEIVGH